MHGQGLTTTKNSTHPFSRISLSPSQLNDAIDLHRTNNQIPVFRYHLLSRYSHLTHGVFTRIGGLSDPPYDHLNTSYSVGDRSDAVTSNLIIIQEAVDAQHLVHMNQSHGNTVFLLDEQHLRKNWDSPAVDAMITDLPGIAVLVKQADCQAVILYDPEKRVVSNAHCGWRGNVRNILGKAVATMTHEFGASPERIVAAIGPSLGPCCAEFIDHQKHFPDNLREFKIGKNHFDLWALSRHQLVAAGLRKENIACAAVCTRCRTDLFYSYRGEGTTGRFGTVVMLK